MPHVTTCDASFKEQSHKRGVAAIVGKWPGDETDEQINDWLEELS